MSQAVDLDAVIAETSAPRNAPRETMDVRQHGPPEPLANTLQRLPELDDDVVLVQINDRAPQHLYPKLGDRGYEYDTVDRDDGPTVTVIWRR